MVARAARPSLSITDNCTNPSSINGSCASRVCTPVKIGAPLASQVKGARPSLTFTLTPTPVRANRAPSGGNAIFGASGGTSKIARRPLKRRNGCGNSAVSNKSVSGGGGGNGTACYDTKPTSSNKIGAASSPPNAPGTGVPSGRPIQTPAT